MDEFSKQLADKIKEYDRLNVIFKEQEKLQEVIGVNYDQQYINNMALALMDEVHEALRETTWKPWKKQQKFDRIKYRDELVDAMHFLVNLCLAHGITADEFFDSYLSKNKENHERQKNNY